MAFDIKNKEIEVIRALFAGGTQSYQAISKYCNVGDFSLNVYNGIYQIIDELYENADPDAHEQLDYRLFLEKFNQNFEVNAKTQSLIDEFYNSAFLAETNDYRWLEDLAKDVHAAAEIRRFSASLEVAKKKIENLEAPNEKDLESVVNGIYIPKPANTEEHQISMVEAILNRTEQYKENKLQKVVSTGFQSLDNFIQGIRSQAITVIAARAGQGKTALGLNLVFNYLKNDPTSKPWLFFSIEMSIEQIADRALCYMTQQHYRNGVLNNPATQKRFLDVLNTLVERDENGEPAFDKPRFEINDESKMDIKALRRAVQSFAIKHNGIGGILIDYIQYMKFDTRNNNRTEAIGDVMNELADICKTYDIPVLVLAQLGRGIESRKGEDAVPRLSDIRDSSSIENTASTVLAIVKENEVSATFHVLKNRLGNGGSGAPVLGKTTVDFNGRAYTFSDPENSYSEL